MKKMLCGAVVVGATLFASASACLADDQPAKTTTPAQTTTPASTTPAARTDTTTTAPTTTTRTRGLRGRRNTDSQRGGRFSNFMANLRGRFGR